MTTFDLRQFVLNHRYRVAFYAVALWLLTMVFANPTVLRDGGVTVFENIKDALLYTRDGAEPNGAWPMEKVLDALESGDSDTKLVALEELGRRRGVTARVALLAAVQSENDPVLGRTAVRSLIAQRDVADEVFLAGYVSTHLRELDPVFIVAMFQTTGSWMFEALEKIRVEHPDPRARQLADWALHHRSELATHASLWQ